MKHNWKLRIMVFICPNCLAGTLKIASSLELPPDSRSDEIIIQILKCSKCEFSGLGVYEETRRGGLDSELFYHRGYHIDNSIFDSIEKMIGQCPKPKKSACKCRVHRSLSRINKSGRWIWLESIPHKEIFKLQII